MAQVQHPLTQAFCAIARCIFGALAWLWCALSGSPRPQDTKLCKPAEGTATKPACRAVARPINKPLPQRNDAPNSVCLDKADGQKTQAVPELTKLPSQPDRPKQATVPSPPTPAAHFNTDVVEQDEKQTLPAAIKPPAKRTVLSLSQATSPYRDHKDRAKRPLSLATIYEDDNEKEHVPLQALGQEVRQRHKKRVGDMLREELLAADRFEPDGASNNDPYGQLAAISRKTLWDDTAQSWLGISQQFVKDSARQTVWVETIDKQGTLSRRPLGHGCASATSPSPTLDAQAKHLLKLCGGNLRWRFQASQVLNQTLPNGAMSALHRAQGIELRGTGAITLGMSHETSFTLRRLSHTRLHIAHTSIWQGEQKPFFVDSLGAHHFEGWAKQTVSLLLLRPQQASAPPELNNVKLALRGSILPTD